MFPSVCDEEYVAVDSPSSVSLSLGWAWTCFNLRAFSFRLGCSQLGEEDSDPVILWSRLPSFHLSCGDVSFRVCLSPGDRLLNLFFQPSSLLEARRAGHVWSFEPYLDQVCPL